MALAEAALEMLLLSYLASSSVSVRGIDCHDARGGGVT